jgi:hypothetical protein
MEMRRLLAGIAALLLGLLVLPVFAADKDDKDKKDPAPDAKKDADKKDDANTEKTIKLGQLVGKVVEVNETKKSIRLQVGYNVSEPNIGEIQALENCKIQLAQAMYRRPPDYNQIASLQQQMAQHAANSTSVERKTKDVEVTGTDDVKVRLAEPPPMFDDKGNIKKRTAKELKELKGDPKDPDFKLPGYPGAFSDLRMEQIVKVNLIKKKDAPKPVGPKPKDADVDLLGENLPQASQIEIVAEPAGK